MTYLQATNFSTGNASISGGNGAFTTLTATNFSSGNITGTFNGTVATSNVSLYDSVSLTSTNQNYYVQLTDRSTTGNGGAFMGTGLTYNPSTNNLATTTFTGTFSGTASITSGSIASGTVVATNFSSGNAQVTGGNSAWTTATATNFSSANIANSNGAFTTLVATNLSSGNAIISGGNAQGLTYLQATNFSTGNAAITGGAISGATGQFSTLTAANFSTGNAVITGGNSAWTTATATNFSSANISNSNGAFTTLTATNFSTGNASISGGNGAFTTLTATNLSSANAVITGGAINGTTVGATTASTGRFTTIVGTSTTDATSTTTGALQVSGGVGIVGNLWVGGNIYAANIVGTTSSILIIQDSLIYLQAPNPNGAYNYDIGFYSDYSNPTYAHVGFSRKQTANAWVLFANVQSEPTATGINWSDAGLAYDSFIAGNIVSANTTPSTSTTTGALIIGGGAGIAGQVYAGGLNTTGGSVLGTATATNFSTANASISGGNGAFTTLTSTNFSSANASISGGNGAFTTLTATNLSSANITGTFNGTTGTSNVALYVAETATTTNQNYYVHLSDRSATSNTAVYVGSGLTFNPSTNNLATTTFTGTFSGTASITSGSIVAGTIVATNFSSGNAIISGGNLQGITYLQATNFSTGNAQITGGAISGATGQFSTLTATNFSTGNAVITGGNATVGYLTAGNISTANAVITGGSITGMNGQFVTLTATNLSSGNLASSNGQFNTLTATNFSTANASISGGNGAFTTLTATNLSSGNLASSNGQFNTLTATNFSTGNASISGGNGAFTTLTATNLSSGNARISGGYADAFPIGANTAATGGFTTLATTGVSTLAGNVVITSGADTVSTTTGALVITGTGGASIASNVYVGNNLYIGATALAQQANFANPTIIAVDSGSNYAQIALKNTNANGSADFAAYADNGTDAGGWVDVGVAGSTYNDANYTITKPQDGSLMVRPTSNSYGGNLVIATSEAGSYNDIVIGVGSFSSTAEVARFHGNTSNSGTFVLKLPTNAVPAANTGAMQVWGGASIGSNAYVGGATTFGGTRAAGGDHIVQGKNDASLIWAKSGASYDQVLIGNSATMSTLVTGAKLQINSTDSILLPTGTNAQRPSSAGGSDVQGMFRYNTTVNGIEWYTGSAWQAATTSFTVIADQQFSGDGGTVAFTLTEAQTTNSCIVSINGVIQIPTLAYSVFSGNLNLVFTEAPASGDVIDVRKITTTQTVLGLASSNGYDQVNVDNSGGVTFYTGSSSPVLQYSIDTSGAWVTQRPNVAVASANTVTTVDSFAVATYRSAKYIVQATAAGKYQVMEALVIHDDTTPTITSYGIVQTNGNVGVLTATISGGTVSVNFVAANASTNVRVKKEYSLI